MSKYMRLIGQNARKASLDKINSKTCWPNFLSSI